MSFWNANALTYERGLSAWVSGYWSSDVIGLTEVRTARPYMAGVWKRCEVHGLLVGKNDKPIRGSVFYWRTDLAMTPVYGEHVLGLHDNHNLLILVYIHPGARNAEVDDTLAEIRKLTKTHREKRVTVGGDFNCPLGSARRRRLDDWLRTHGMTNIQHENSYTSGSGKESQLDLVIVREEDKHDATTCVKDSQSDHMVVRVQLHNAKTTPSIDNPARLSRKQLRAFGAHVQRNEAELAHVVTNTDLNADALTAEFEEKLLAVAKQAANGAQRRKRLDGVPKSKRLRKLQRQYFSARQLLKTLPAERRTRLMRRARRLLRKIKDEVKAIRKLSIAKFARKVNLNHNLLFDTRRRAVRRRNIAQVDAQVLADHFWQADQRLLEEEAKADGPLAPVFDGEVVYEYLQPSADEVQLLNRPFLVEEVRAALMRSAPHKAPGSCGITAALLRSGGPTLWSLLARLYNRLWTGHEYPRHFNSGTVTAVLKPGKPARSATSYRPISLLCVVWKTMEKMVNARLTRFLACRTHPEQAGFKPGRNTTQQIFALQHAYATFGDDATAMCLDASAAFDRISRRAAVEEARRRGISAGLERRDAHFESWLKLTLLPPSTRTVRVRMQTSKCYTLQCGVPQGSAIAPSLFTLCSDRLLLRARLFLRQTGRADDGAVYGFADDLAIVARDPKLCGDIAEQLRQEAMTVNLAFNASKTQLMSKRDNARLTFDGKTLTGADSVVYLGATIQRSGYTTKTLMLGKLHQRVGEIRWLLREEHLNLKVKAKLVHAAILPAVLYACSVSWFSAAAKGAMDRAVMQLVSDMVRVSGQRTDAYDILRNELGILPVEAYIDAQRKVFIVTHTLDDDDKSDNTLLDLRDDERDGPIDGPSARAEHFTARTSRPSAPPRNPRPSSARPRRRRTPQCLTVARLHQDWREFVRSTLVEARRLIQRANEDHHFGGKHGKVIRRRADGERVSSRDYARAVAKLLARQTLAEKRSEFDAALRQSATKRTTVERYLSSGRHMWPKRERGALPAYLKSHAAGYILCLRAERLPIGADSEHIEQLSGDCPLCYETLQPHERNEHFILRCAAVEREWSRTRATFKRMQRRQDRHQLLEQMMRLDSRWSGRHSDAGRLSRTFETELPAAYKKWVRLIQIKWNEATRVMHSDS